MTQKEVTLDNISGKDKKLFKLIKHCINSSKEIEIEENSVTVVSSLKSQKNDTFLKKFALNSFEKDIFSLNLDDFCPAQLKSKSQYENFSRDNRISGHSITIDMNPDLKPNFTTIESSCIEIKNLFELFLNSPHFPEATKYELSNLILESNLIAKTFSPKTYKKIDLTFTFKNSFIFPFHCLRMPSFIQEIFTTNDEEILSEENNTLVSKIKNLQETRSKFITKILNHSENDLNEFLTWPEYLHLIEAQSEFLAQKRPSKNLKSTFNFDINISPYFRQLIYASRNPLFPEFFEKTKKIIPDGLEDGLKEHLNSLFIYLIKLEKIVYEKIKLNLDKIGIPSHVLDKKNDLSIKMTLDKRIIHEFCKDLFSKNPYLLLFSAGIIDTFKNEDTFNNYCLSHDVIITELTKKTMGNLPFHYIY